MDFVKVMKAYYEPLRNQRQILESLKLEDKILVLRALREERILSDIFEEKVPLLTGSFLALDKIPLNLENIGNDLNLDLVVNQAVAVVNELQESLQKQINLSLLFRFFARIILCLLIIIHLIYGPYNMDSHQKVLVIR